MCKTEKHLISNVMYVKSLPQSMRLLRYSMWKCWVAIMGMHTAHMQVGNAACDIARERDTLRDCVSMRRPLSLCWASGGESHTCRTRVGFSCHGNTQRFVYCTPAAESLHIWFTCIYPNTSPAVWYRVKIFPLSSQPLILTHHYILSLWMRMYEPLRS